jgi:anti-sigma B factor antagonist
MSQTFQALVRAQPRRSTLDLAGELNGAADEALNAAYAQAESGNPSTIVLNFSQVSYINSTGIALIVGLMARARKAHRQLAVYGLSEHYKEIFQVTRLADFLAVYEDETAARVGVGAVTG